MEHKKLKEKREQMIDFLLDNIVAEDIERRDNDIVFADNEGRKFFIKTLSKQADLPYDFEPNSHNFDEDRRKLHAIQDHLASMIVKMNGQGYIPGFVLLEAETNYPQLSSRTEHFVNWGHFLKQRLPSRFARKPSKSNKLIDPIELVLQQFYRFNSLNADKRRVFPDRGEFRPELIYFNSRHNKLRTIYFTDSINNPHDYKNDSCPVCSQPNEADHEECKTKQSYISYARTRDNARYSKLIYVSKERKSPSRDSHLGEPGYAVAFEPATLDSRILSLPKDRLRIAVLK